MGQWTRAVRYLLWLMAVGLGMASISSAHSDEPYPADAIKAAFLYRFTGYVDWPADSLQEANFTIAVLNAPLVATELGRLLAQRSIKDRPAKVVSIRTVTEIGKAQMLYVGRDFSGDLAPLIQSVEDRSVLLVTDRDGALDEGSAVNFLPVDRRVRFEISLPAATRAGLKLQSGLLSVAASVRGGPRSEVWCGVLFPVRIHAQSCEWRVAQL